MTFGPPRPGDDHPTDSRLAAVRRHLRGWWRSLQPATPDEVAPEGRSSAAPGRRGPYVCPFCGRTFATDRGRCAGCDGLPIVPRDARAVYETVLPGCGARCDPDAARPRHGHR